MTHPNFFATGSPFLHHPLLTLERTAQEVDFIVSNVPIPENGRILDVGCGFGRHSIAFAQRGFTVTGIDPAAAMIDAAKQRAAEAGAIVDFQPSAGESFAAEEKFDTAVCLFTTLGQMSASGSNVGLVERVYASLKPGGYFVVEVPQRDTAVAQLKPSEQFGAGERYTAVTRHYDANTHIVTETFDLVSPNETRTYLLQYRLFSREEVAQLLTRTGFTLLTTFSDYSGKPLVDDSPTMIFIAQK